MSNIQKDIIVYDIEDMKKTSNDFKEKLHGLIELADYGSCKIGVYENKLYVSWSWFQAFQRTFYGENRDTLVDFLKNVFEDYRIFHRMINACLINRVHVKEINEISKEHNVLIRKWMQGLGLLKEQYKDDKEIVDEIKKIISKYVFY